MYINGPTVTSSSDVTEFITSTSRGNARDVTPVTEEYVTIRKIIVLLLNDVTTVSICILF